MIAQRDLLLVPFPFSDQSGRKVRPVIVISNTEFNEHSEDCIVIGITSNISKDRYALPLANSDLEQGNLLTLCTMKAENILKIDKELIVKKIGKIKREKFSRLIAIFKHVIEEDS